MRRAIRGFTARPVVLPPKASGDGLPGWVPKRWAARLRPFKPASCPACRGAGVNPPVRAPCGIWRLACCWRTPRIAPGAMPTPRIIPALPHLLIHLADRHRQRVRPQRVRLVLRAVLVPVSVVHHRLPLGGTLGGIGHVVPLGFHSGFARLGSRRVVLPPLPPWVFLTRYTGRSGHHPGHRPFLYARRAITRHSIGFCTFLHGVAPAGGKLPPNTRAISGARFFTARSPKKNTSTIRLITIMAVCCCSLKAVSPTNQTKSRYITK